jgi:predicted NBD/HSP70 family sugar kinase
MTIGQRAAEAIKERASKNGTTIKQECEKNHIGDSQVRGWRRGKADPCAYVLAMMLRNGYDINHILKGESE